MGATAGLLFFAVLVVFAVIVVAKSVALIPQAEAAVVERLGRYSRTVSGQLTLLVPFIDRIRARIDLRERVVSFPPQPVITEDNLTLNIDTVVYFQVTNPQAAVYEISNYIVGVEQLTTTTLRNVVGGMTLEQTLTSRDQINGQLRGVLDEATGRWGLRVARVELRSIDPPPSIQASMAGEAGRGFAVVADEVQRLAERAANATKQIEVLVRTIQTDTNEAVVSMERSTTDVVGGALLAENAGAALEEIEQVSNQIASLVQNISASARQQAAASGNISKNMQVVREISTQTAEGSTATSTSIAKLAALSAQLRKSVAGFRLPDYGAGTTTVGAVAPVAGLKPVHEPINSGPLNPGPANPGPASAGPVAAGSSGKMRKASGAGA